MNRQYILMKLAQAENFKQVFDRFINLSPDDQKQFREAVQTTTAYRNALHTEGERAAAKAKGARPFRAAAKEGLQDLLKATPKTVLLGGAALASPIVKAKLEERFMPKPRLSQQLFGKGSVGRTALALGGAAALLGGGIAATEKATEAIKKPLERRSFYKKMLKFSPGLKKEDPKAVSSIFNTLYKFNPKMASDPLVASSFLKRSLQFKDEGIQPMDVKTLTEVSKNIQQSKGRGSSILGEAFPTTASALSGMSGL